MSDKTRKWNIGGYAFDEAKSLCERGFNPLIAVLLASRGMCGKAEELFGDLTTEDPFAIKDMDKAVARLREAVDKKQHVAVYGDYDVDGITASCVMCEYLRSKGLECDIYIPERLEEGYGVKSTGLEYLRAKGVELVITVDCGVTAVCEAAHAKEIGLDMIITDHHECGEVLPDAVAVVDPKRPDSDCRARVMAGVGVAFKLICAAEGADKTEELFEKYGDLVAVGTVADVMPVVGENRKIIRRGLEIVREGRRLGLREIIAAAGMVDKKITVTGVGYTIAPRINAAGRLGKTDVAVNLLLTESAAEAASLADELCAMNRERQEIEAKMYAEALEMLEKEPPEGKPIVLAGRDWHQGVAGIVASRVAEKFSLPTVMICLKDGIGRGSCRSCGQFSIFEALRRCSDALVGFGGHDMAAGLVIEEDNVNKLRAALAGSYEQTDIKKEATLDIDFEVIKPRLLSIENVESLATLEPCGCGNPQPVLCMKNVSVENVVSLSEGKHTKMWVEKNGEIFEAVYFRRSAENMGAVAGGRADIAFTPQINEFRGKRGVQLNLIDFRPAE